MSVSAKLGDWSWYVGHDEHDDEMMHSVTREQALIDGARQVKEGQPFYIVEARMYERDERAMGRGDLDSAVFAETRNGEWITKPTTP